MPEVKYFDVSFVDQSTVSKYIQQLQSSHADGPDRVLFIYNSTI